MVIHLMARIKMVAGSRPKSPDQPPVAPSCAPLHGYLGTNFRGGPGALVLDRQISVLTGKGIDGIRGDYALASVEIQ